MTSDVYFLGASFLNILALVSISTILFRDFLLSKRRLDPDALDCSHCFSALFSAANATAVPRNDDSHAKVIKYASLAVLIFYLSLAANMLVSYVSLSALEWLPFRYGATAVTVSCLLYLCAKTSTYLVFIGRLDSSFKGSFVGYSNKVINALRVFVAGYTLVMCALVANFAAERDSYHYSKRGMPAKVLFGFLIFDIIFTPLIVYLFYSALNSMLKGIVANMNRRTLAADRDRNPEFHLLPLKITVMSAVATVTTLATLGISAVTGMGMLLLPIDGVINSICIVLMNKSWEPLYVLYCTPLMRCLAAAPCIPCAGLTEVQLIDLITERTGDIILDHMQAQAAAQPPVAVVAQRAAQPQVQQVQLQAQAPAQVPLQPQIQATAQVQPVAAHRR